MSIFLIRSVSFHPHSQQFTISTSISLTMSVSFYLHFNTSLLQCQYPQWSVSCHPQNSVTMRNDRSHDWPVHQSQMDVDSFLKVFVLLSETFHVEWKAVLPGLVLQQTLQEGRGFATQQVGTLHRLWNSPSLLLVFWSCLQQAMVHSKSVQLVLHKLSPLVLFIIGHDTW